MIPNPHDLIVKAVFGQPEHARGMLRAIAPAVLAEALDWSTLTLQPGSFVDAALSSRHTDLLYSTTWCDGGEMLVYLQFEHYAVHRIIILCGAADYVELSSAARRGRRVRFA